MKRLLLFIALSMFVIKASAQQTITQKNLIGKWVKHYKTYDLLIQFDNDDKIKFLSSNGVVLRQINYTCEVKNNLIRMKYLSDIEPSHHRLNFTEEIKLLNDSTMLVAYKKMPANADSASKNIIVFKKVKNPNSLLTPRLPDAKDLVGKWFLMIRRSDSPVITFTDTSAAILTIKRKQYQATYKLDFGTQPAHISFKLTLSGEIYNGLIEFINEKELKFQLLTEGDSEKYFALRRVEYLERRMVN